MSEKMELGKIGEDMFDIVNSLGAVITNSIPTFANFQTFAVSAGGASYAVTDIPKATNLASPIIGMATSQERTV